jgi:hypothetical protein
MDKVTQPILAVRATIIQEFRARELEAWHVLLRETAKPTVSDGIRSTLNAAFRPKTTSKEDPTKRGVRSRLGVTRRDRPSERES